MFLEQAAWTLASAVIGGLIVGIVVTIVQNHPRIIRAKTKAEALQKLKLNNIIDIINETEELKRSIADILFQLADIVTKTNSRVIKLIIKIYDKEANKLSNEGLEVRKLKDEILQEFRENSKASALKIENFIFLLRKEMIVDKENSKIKKETEVIEAVYVKLMRSPIIKANFQDDEKISDIKEMLSEPHKILNDYNEYRNVISKSIERILKMYKKKLDKEQESWLDKSSICFRKIKIIFMKIKRKSRLQDKP